MKIIVDCLGGDNSPAAEVEGAVLALKNNKELRVVLVGDEEKIREILTRRRVRTPRIEIVHAPEEVTGNDKPIDAVRLKKNSSMIRAIRMLREDESVDAMVSNGATGVLVAAAVLKAGIWNEIQVNTINTPVVAVVAAAVPVVVALRASERVAPVAVVAAVGLPGVVLLLVIHSMMSRGIFTVSGLKVVPVVVVVTAITVPPVQRQGSGVIGNLLIIIRIYQKMAVVEAIPVKKANPALPFMNISPHLMR